jgi:hypothetical protein
MLIVTMMPFTAAMIKVGLILLLRTTSRTDYVALEVRLAIKNGELKEDNHTLLCGACWTLNSYFMFLPFAGIAGIAWRWRKDPENTNQVVGNRRTG